MPARPMPPTPAAAHPLVLAGPVRRRVYAQRFARVLLESSDRVRA